MNNGSCVTRIMQDGINEFLIKQFAILAAEGAQLLFRVGSFDIDDIILNLLGVLIGYAAFKAAFPVYKSMKKA